MYVRLNLQDFINDSLYVQEYLADFDIFAHLTKTCDTRDTCEKLENSKTDSRINSDLNS